MLLDLDLEALGDLIVQTTKDAVAPFQARIIALEAELVTVKAAPDQSALMSRLDALDAGQDSIRRDVDLRLDLQAAKMTLWSADESIPIHARLSALEAELVTVKAVAGVPGPHGPAGQDGAAGKDGLPGEPGPPGSAGRDGTPGIDGKDGLPGRDGVDGKDGAPGPIGERGPMGEKGADGIGLIGPVGPDGAPGRDGIHGRDGLPGVSGPTGEKGMDGAAGLNGKDGRDGTLENLKVHFDGERTVTFCFKDGTPIDGGAVTLPTVLYRGVYVAGQAYEKNDAVTSAGHLWIARDTTTKKPEGVGLKDWQLSVRAGRDGKEGEQGKEGGRGPKGDKGDPGIYR